MNKVKLITIFICITTISLNIASCKGSNSEPVVSAAQSTDSDTSAVSASVEDNSIKYFTLEELKQYNGADGNPMYAAVNVIVYDVTEIRQWLGGQHEGYQAGTDLKTSCKNHLTVQQF